MNRLGPQNGPIVKNETKRHVLHFDRNLFSDLVARDFSLVPADEWEKVKILLTDSDQMGSGIYGTAFNALLLRESRLWRARYFLGKSVLRLSSKGKMRKPSSKWVLEQAEGKDVLVAVNLNSLEKPYKNPYGYYPVGWLYTLGEIMAHEIQHTATRLSQNLGKNNYANGEPPARAYSIFAGGDWDQVLTSEITD